LAVETYLIFAVQANLNRKCSKKYQTEVTEMKKIMLLLSKVTCIMAMALAVLSVNSTCGFTAYQPDVPESLEHD